MIERPVHWAATDEALSVYRAGELVARIPAAQYGELLYALAAVMRKETR